MNLWCVNCGELSRTVRRVALCPHCDYDGIVEFDDEEFQQECQQRHILDLIESPKKKKPEPSITIEPERLKGVLEA